MKPYLKKSLNRGFVESRIVIFALALIAIIFLVFFMWDKIEEVIAEITGIDIGYDGGGPGQEFIVLEAAIECSYYRCMEGCDSDEVKGISWSGIDCLDFCVEEEYKDGEGRICGDNAKNYPIIVQGEGSIFKDKIDFEVDCLTPGMMDPMDVEDIYVMVENEIVSDTSENTYCYNPIGAPAYNMPVGRSWIKFKDGTHYIYTYTVDAGPWWGKYKVGQTRILGSDPSS